MVQVIDRSFGFDTAVEEAQRAINAAHVEAESIENGIGVVKLMGRYSGNYSHFMSTFLYSSLVMEILILMLNLCNSYVLITNTAFILNWDPVAGFIAMYATLASRDVDCCLIPESPFFLEGRGGLFEFIEKRLKENGHMVIVIAEGAGQDLLSESMNQQDASGNKLLKDVGLWISQRIKVLLAILSIFFFASHDIMKVFY